LIIDYAIPGCLLPIAPLVYGQPHILDDLLEQLAAVALEGIEHVIVISQVEIGPRFVVASCIVLLVFMIL
jgi:hypothetical protein